MNSKLFKSDPMTSLTLLVTPRLSFGCDFENLIIFLRLSYYDYEHHGQLDAV
jgi:hypothetical protein